MRQRDETRMLLQQVAREIADIGVQFVVVQAIQHRLFVDDAVAREVEQHTALAHDPDALGVDQILGRRHQWRMQADEIAVLDQILHRSRFLHLRRQAPGRIDGDFRVVADDVHAEANRGIRDQGADCAQADHAQGAAGQFMPDEGLLAGLDLFMQRLVVALQAGDEVDRRRQIACAQQHACYHQFLDRVGVGAGRVEHRHAALAHRLHRDVVGACAGAADGHHAGGDIHRMHVLRTHQNSIRRRDIVADSIGLRQTREPAFGNGIQGKNFPGFGHASPFRESIKRPAGASFNTPAA